MFHSMYARCSLLSLIFVGFTTASPPADLAPIATESDLPSALNHTALLNANNNISLSGGKTGRTWFYSDEAGRSINMTKTGDSWLPRDDAIDMLVSGFAELLVQIPGNHKATYRHARSTVFQTSGGVNDAFLTLFDTTVSGKMTYNTIRVALHLLWRMILQKFDGGLPSVKLKIDIDGYGDDKAVLEGQITSLQSSPPAGAGGDDS